MTRSSDGVTKISRPYGSFGNARLFRYRGRVEEKRAQAPESSHSRVRSVESTRRASDREKSRKVRVFREPRTFAKRESRSYDKPVGNASPLGGKDPPTVRARDRSRGTGTSTSTPSRSTVRETERTVSQRRRNPKNHLHRRATHEHI